MRIQADDTKFEDDLVPFVDLEEDGDDWDEELEDDEEEELDSDMEEYLVNTGKINKVSIDMNSGKALAVILLFAIMFALPVGLYENYDKIIGGESSPVYSESRAEAERNQDTSMNSTADDNSSVLGISTASTQNNQVFGLPTTAVVLVFIGLLMIILSSFYFVLTL